MGDVQGAGVLRVLPVVPVGSKKLAGLMCRILIKPSQSSSSYPFTANIDKENQLGDTILYKAGYIIREAVEDGMECAKKEKTRMSTTYGNEISSSSS